MPEFDGPIEALSDNDVMAQTRWQLPVDHGTAKRIIGWSTPGRILPEEQQGLLVFTQTYRCNWLRQSVALAEAIRRGLLPAMHS